MSADTLRALLLHWRGGVSFYAIQNRESGRFVNRPFTVGKTIYAEVVDGQGAPTDGRCLACSYDRECSCANAKRARYLRDNRPLQRAVLRHRGGYVLGRPDYRQRRPNRCAVRRYRCRPRQQRQARDYQTHQAAWRRSKGRRGSRSAQSVARDQLRLRWRPRPMGARPGAAARTMAGLGPSPRDGAKGWRPRCRLAANDNADRRRALPGTFNWKTGEARP